jgi:hypothetical protein
VSTYRERPRCPLWLFLVYLTYMLIIVYIPVGIFSALGEYDLVDALILLPIPLVFAFLFPLFSCLTIRVRGDSLTIGRILTIPVSAIFTMRPVFGKELDGIRREMLDLGPPAGNVIWLNAIPGLNLLGSALSGMAWGYRVMKAENRTRGMHCAKGQEPALLIETPSLKTKRWLVAARDPSRLEDAITAVQQRAAGLTSTAEARG